MRIALATLLCTLGLITSGEPGARAGDKADAEKELKKEIKKFRGASS
jgi:hypothetical protein